ncbi:phytoene desaturase family protein [Microbacterium sp. No. 7]|uniref:phytoene desaturase family protein n=1 Tax=Microbacterium sp. No. 7 TaxID=1714373 RepID=UPI0006D246AE|nr:NAD(P)/FAD-dependent oxidoreductase [Microbacterium sp. No. 7]ALJ19487.1 FAD-dependent oxidoreductase [Microbacterium sp. No. 7]
MTRAVVVGSGPNGLAAATVLARAGLEVTVFEAADELGGGARSVEGPLEGLIQDHCAAVHPMAAASDYIASWRLEERGVRWARAPLDAAHPLDDGTAGLLAQDLDVTARGLGADGRLWRAMFGAPSRRFDDLAEMIFRPTLRWPAHPVLFARFGAVAGPPPALVASALRTEQGRALYAGVAAHAITDLRLPLVGGIGAGILSAGHAVGWPVVEGGTGVLTNAIVAGLRELGVRFETGVHIGAERQLPRHDVAMYDLHPRAVAQILGDRLPRRTRAAYRRFRSGPAAFKVDLAVEGGIPWTHPAVGTAGTVHLGGSAREIVATERDTARGIMPERPFVLVGQQFVADPSRAAGDVKPVYAYAHVPTGFQGDATDAIVAQIERFAPGFRDRIVALRVQSATEMSRANPNFRGGDILTGAKLPLPFLLGPRITPFPYDTGAPGAYLCSAATPPGPGIHGCSGANAAERALHRLEHGPRR